VEPFASASTPVILATQEAEIRRIKARATSLESLSRKNASHKRGGGVVQSIGPEFNSQYIKKRTGRSPTLSLAVFLRKEKD
jgi:hypothetical protein